MYQNPYHNPYHNPHHYPYYGIPDTYMDYYDSRSHLTDMYPEVYRTVYPRVVEVCTRYDVYTHPRMYPQVDPAMIQEMTDEIYGLCTQEVDAEQFGPRGIFRDLITILLIRQLLRRRRRRPFFGFSGNEFF
ncbi:hypothetical protein SAMN05446037_101082 [Anaerovirgula multivorans]|uniref:Uncharacterized protein n=1 Tax=Anaerovirgula multivorans TaxID=312168 RepID=A0A239ELE7_9FIRM|nr:hypothetical protein [Anaerovirgula multivorans]SNS45088.1 hypothetical protein SAMN05446037_101082 [Anaerovirgula multivorans]